VSGRLLCNACGHEKRLAPAWIDELRARAPEAAAENDVIAYFLHRFKCSQCQAKNFNIVPEEVAPKAEDDGAASPLCTKCGDVISFKRMRAVPGTPFCIHCQEEFEKGPREDEFDLCKKCGARMVQRVRESVLPTKYFLGCSNYPRCRFVIAGSW